MRSEAGQAGVDELVIMQMGIACGDTLARQESWLKALAWPCGAQTGCSTALHNPTFEPAAQELEAATRRVPESLCKPATREPL